MNAHIHTELAHHRKIAIIWSTEDVLSIRPDLTDEQAWQVLLAAKASHDANLGISWDILAYHASDIFGVQATEDSA